MVNGRIFTPGETIAEGAVDRVVGLEEAWRSGAGDWQDTERARFAADTANLVVTTREVVEQKNGEDPTGWLPEHNTCEYLAIWVAVKTDWGLTVDPREKQAVRDALVEHGSCADLQQLGMPAPATVNRPG